MLVCLKMSHKIVRLFIFSLTFFFCLFFELDNFCESFSMFIDFFFPGISKLLLRPLTEWPQNTKAFQLLCLSILKSNLKFLFGSFCSLSSSIEIPCLLIPCHHLKKILWTYLKWLLWSLCWIQLMKPCRVSSYWQFFSVVFSMSYNVWLKTRNFRHSIVVILDSAFIFSDVWYISLPSSLPFFLSPALPHLSIFLFLFSLPEHYLWNLYPF